LRRDWAVEIGQEMHYNEGWATTLGAGGPECTAIEKENNIHWPG
jgi:hypothetical protein